MWTLGDETDFVFGFDIAQSGHGYTGVVCGVKNSRQICHNGGEPSLLPFGDSTEKIAHGIMNGGFGCSWMRLAVEQRGIVTKAMAVKKVCIFKQFVVLLRVSTEALHSGR